MRLTVTPALWSNQVLTLEEFVCTEHEKSSFPSSKCMWRPTKDGIFLCAPDICGKMNEPYVKWLIYLIERYFEPWKRKLNGLLIQDTFVAYIRNSEIILTSMKDVNVKLIWNVESGYERIKETLYDILRAVFMQKGMGEWKIVESLDEQSSVDHRNRILYIHEAHLLKYCKTNGMKSILDLLKTRLTTMESEMYVDGQIF
jgi:hypothetical protein